MRVGGFAANGRPCAAAVFLRCSKPTPPIKCSAPSFTSSTATISSDHICFIKDVAATHPPQHLHQLLNMLRARGEAIVSPGARKGLIPLVIPLSENHSGSLTALLRWPTSPPDMEMPVVEVGRYGVWLLAKNVDQYIHRILVEEDAKNSQETNGTLFEASSIAGEKLYRRGGYAESKITNLDVYLSKKVGLFPDVLERKVADHLEKGDHVSALVTGEFYAKGHFPGFGRPFVFNAEEFCVRASRVGRNKESKDAARSALKSPWWTLGCRYQEAAEIAEWEDEPIEYLKEKVSEEGRLEDLKKGKAPAQVALDQAAFLLDLASLEGTWDEIVEQIAERYKEAGLDDISRFVLYGD